MYFCGKEWKKNWKKNSNFKGKFKLRAKHKKYNDLYNKNEKKKNIEKSSFFPKNRQTFGHSLSYSKFELEL